MNAEPWELLVVVASTLNLLCWGYFATRVLHLRQRHLPVPTYLTAAAIVGTFAASAAGWVASISLLNIVSPGALRTIRGRGIRGGRSHSRGKSKAQTKPRMRPSVNMLGSMMRGTAGGRYAGSLRGRER